MSQDPEREATAGSRRPGDGVDASWFSAALGLGGNIGDAAAAIVEALGRLAARPDLRVTAVSRLHRTPPWGKTDQAWFFNACAAIETQLAPHALLAACLDVERAMKRERLERWGPRTIDLDILLYAGLVSDTPDLTVPHPRMTERAFVLQPLSDILPDEIVAGRSVADWAREANADGIEIADARPDWWRGTAGA